METKSSFMDSVNEKGSVRSDGAVAGGRFWLPPTHWCEELSGSRLQSADKGAGLATSAGVFRGAAASAGVSIHLRTSGKARRIASSPTRINSPARLKSS